MFGIFSLFGKSKPMAALEAALREAGLHPRLIWGQVLNYQFSSAKPPPWPALCASNTLVPSTT